MGSTVWKIQGAARIQPPLNVHEREYLDRFVRSRRIDYADGPYITDGISLVKDASGHNRPPEGQPNLWCEWRVDATGERIAWSGQTKFHDGAEWLRYLIDTFLRPGARVQFEANERTLTGQPDAAHPWHDPAFRHFTFDHTVTGIFQGMGRDVGDVWNIVVIDNRVLHVDISDLMVPVVEQIIDVTEIDNAELIARLRKMAREEDNVTRRAKMMRGASAVGSRICECGCPSPGTDLCHCAETCPCEPDCGFCNEPAEPDGPSYADRMNAPLSPETIVALNAALTSDNPARFKRTRARDEDVPAEVKDSIARVREWYDTHDAVTGDRLDVADYADAESTHTPMTLAGPATPRNFAEDDDDQPGCEVVATGMTVCVNPEAGYEAMMAEQDAEKSAYREAFPDGKVRYDEDAADRGSWKDVRTAIQAAQKTAGELLDSLEVADLVQRQRWNLWSHRHQLWWGPNRKGYVTRQQDAGLYTTAEVVDVVGHGMSGWVPESDHRSVPNTIAIPAA